MSKFIATSAIRGAHGAVTEADEQHKSSIAAKTGSSLPITGYRIKSGCWILRPGTLTPFG